MKSDSAIKITVYILRGVAVTSLGVSTRLLYIGPG